MVEARSLPDNPLYWPLDALIDAYRRRELSPVDVLELTLARIDALDPTLHAYLGRLDEVARQQARAAEDAYRRGDPGALCGVPVAIKDTFQIENQVTTFGSLAYRSTVSASDCGVVERLRGAGAVFTGRSNTAEFGQSATTENRFFPDVSNPWDVARTTGGSSGGAAASVAAGLCSIALGADGGGSIRIPAAFAGLVGFKPTFGLCKNERGLGAMSDFVCPGPLSWCVADARRMLQVLAGTTCARETPKRGQKIGWCAHPMQRPTDPEMDAVVGEAVQSLSSLGHRIEDCDLPLEGWDDVFGPLVLGEELARRGHLLETADILTDYVEKTLRAAQRLTDDDLERARAQHADYRQRVQSAFDNFDFLLTPTTAVTAFPIGAAPRSINGERVSRTWGAFPFTAPFNVAGNPALTLPCGFAGGLPVGLQVVAPLGADERLLDLAQDMEALLRYERQPIIDKWAVADADGELQVCRR